MTKNMIMKKYIFCIVIALFGFNLSLDSVPPKRDIENAQISMVGPRFYSLGRSNPIIRSDISGVFINPASLSSDKATPFSYSQQKLLGQYEIMLLQGSVNYDVPLFWIDNTEKQAINIGFSYGTNTLSDIPTTIKDNDVIRSTGLYSAGFNIYNVTASTTYYGMFYLDELYTGINGKYFEQYIDSDKRGALSVDVGMIGVYNKQLYWIDQMSFGLSLLNFIPRQIEWSDKEKGTAKLPIQLLLGGKLEMFQNTLSVFAHNTESSIALGSEYFFENNMVVRGSTDFNTLSLGTGIIFDQLTGIGDSYYSARLDFNYSQYQKPLNSDPTYSFGVTILGDAKLKTPTLLSPKRDIFVNKQEVFLRGVGPKNSVIQLFNNGNLSRTVMSDKYGFWKKDGFPLVEGENEVFARGYSLENEDSNDSEHRLITSDTIPPEFDVVVYPSQTKLIVSLKTDDQIKFIKADINGKRLKFFEIDEGEWQATVDKPDFLEPNAPLPNEMSELTISAIDHVDNIQEEEIYPFFLSLDYPKNKHVHYKEALRYIGKTSYLTQAIFINGEEASIDVENNFSFIQRLDPGKNLVDVTYFTLNDVELSTQLKILRLETFPDIVGIKERREIEFLATLGVLHGDKDKNFYPDRPVTKGYLTKMMVNIMGYELPKIEDDIFLDVLKDDPDASYIAAAIENGLVFASPTGLFEPEQELTFDEVAFYLSNSDIIDEVEETRETEPMTRRQLAEFLAFTPDYEVQIERLIDWEKGYSQ